MKTRRTLRAVAIGCLVVGACASVAYAQGANFTYGHIFVSVHESESCLNGQDAIFEIDPTTGQWTFFADPDDGLCLVTGLGFTPDGRRLLCLNGNSPGSSLGRVLSFSANGAGEVVLDVSDGLFKPSGENGLAFNALGDLYVVDSLTISIVRFPGGTGPGTEFADSADGITGSGALDFAPNGDLFYTSALADGVIRITPDGVGSVFDVLPNGSSVVFDRLGNLFVTAEDPELATVLYRYDNGDAKARRVLASGFIGGSAHAPITLSPDESSIYLVDLTNKVYAIDVNDGTTTVVADFSDIPFGQPPGSHGIAVYAPASIPAVSLWGALSMSLLLIVAGTLVIGRGRLKFAARVGSPVSGES